MSKTQTKLRKNLDGQTSNAEIMLDGDPQVVAQNLVALIPLDDVCQNKELMDAFLSEMFLAVARASSRENRRKRQAEGIAAAKARGVQFGKKSPPLPDNFDMVRRDWRNGEYNLIQAAKLCGMPKSTFFNAVQRAEEAEAEARKAIHTEGGECRDVKESARNPRQGRTDHPIRYDQSPPLSDAGASRAI